jgi:hypothetical protein
MSIKQKLIVVKKRGWTWNLREPELLEGWFDHYEKLVRNAAVKSNAVRTVFKVNDTYYVKLDQPARLDHKVRAYFRCKAEQEFNAAMLLEDAGLPVVKYLGWGRRGQHSMLLSAAVKSAVPLQNLMFHYYERTGADYSRFVTHLTVFLRKVLNSGIYHPDFHFGNILFDKAAGNFTLVDVYGVTRPRIFAQSKLDTMGHIIFGLTTILSDREMISVIQELGLRTDRNEAAVYLREGLIQSAKLVTVTWHKRRKQILHNYKKFITVFKYKGNEYLLRHSSVAEPYVTAFYLPDVVEKESLPKQILPHQEALALWIKSFKLQLFGVAHRMPLIMSRQKNGTVLYFDKIDGRPPLQGSGLCTEFINRCQICGFTVHLSNLCQNPAGKIFIDSIDEIHLEDCE